MGGPRTLWLLGTRGRQIGGAGAFVTETRRRSVAEDILTRCCWCWTVKLLLPAACMPVEGRYSCCCTARPPNYQHKFAWLMGTPDEQRRGALQRQRQHTPTTTTTGAVREKPIQV